MGLKDKLNKLERFNVSAKLVVPVLDDDEVEELGKYLNGFPQDERPERRAAWVEERASTRLVVTRIAEAERAFVQSDATIAMQREMDKLGVAIDFSEGAPLPTSAMLAYNRESNLSLWKKIQDHIDSAEDRQPDGSWKQVDAGTLRKAVELIDKRSTVIRDWIVQTYIKVAKDDEEAARSDPGFLDEDSSKPSTSA